MMMRWKGSDVFDYKNQMHFKGLGRLFDGVLEVNVKPVINRRQDSFFQMIYKGVVEYMCLGLEYALGVILVFLGYQHRSWVLL